MVFTKYRQEKDATAEGLYLTHLKCQEFIYNIERKTIGPSLEPDGI